MPIIIYRRILKVKRVNCRRRIFEVWQMLSRIADENYLYLYGYQVINDSFHQDYRSG
jgi:hypothetical protein